MDKVKEYPCGITIRQEEKRYYIGDKRNGFRVYFEKKMIKQFYSSIILISKICREKDWQSISYHQYLNHDTDCDFVTREIVKSYRGNSLMNGNYFDATRDKRMIECLEDFFKLKPKDFILPDINDLDLYILLILKRYQNEKD